MVPALWFRGITEMISVHSIDQNIDQSFRLVSRMLLQHLKSSETLPMPKIIATFLSELRDVFVSFFWRDLQEIQDLAIVCRFE